MYLYLVVVTKGRRAKQTKDSQTEMEEVMSPKTIRPHKPHRKLLSGLKLLNTAPTTNTCDNPSSPTDGWNKKRLHLSDEGIKIPENTPENTHQHIPHDIIAHQILTRLPIKSLLQFKSVSKEWNSTISSHAFATAQFKASVSSPVLQSLFIQAENNHYLLFYQEDDPLLEYSLIKLEAQFLDEQHKNEIQLVGSCNGVVCLAYSSPAESYFYLWNPITNLWFGFPDPHILASNSRTSWGFAFVASQNDYKVVRLIQDYTNLELIVDVFSLRARKWARVDHHGLGRAVCLTKSDPGVLVGETLFWLMEVRSDPARSPMVVGFDLGSERFERNVELEPRSVTPWFQCLYDMGGSLALYGLSEKEEVCVSVLKGDGRVESIGLSKELRPRFCSGLVGFTKAGRFFLVSKNWELGLVDPNVVPAECTTLMAFKKGRRPAMIRYVPTFVSGFSVRDYRE